jgi:hypothetical protein
MPLFIAEKPVATGTLAASVIVDHSGGQTRKNRTAPHGVKPVFRGGIWNNQNGVPVVQGNAMTPGST